MVLYIIAILVWSIICFFIGYIAALSKATNEVEWLSCELEKQIKKDSYGKEEKNEEKNKRVKTVTLHTKN